MSLSYEVDLGWGRSWRISGTTLQFSNFLVNTGLVNIFCMYLDQTLVTFPIYDEASSHHSRVRTLKVCVMKATQHQKHTHSKAFCFKIHSTSRDAFYLGDLDCRPKTLHSNKEDFEVIKNYKYSSY